MQKKHIHEVKKTTHVHYKGIFISIQKQPSCENSMWTQKAKVKKDVKSKVAGKKWL